MNVHKNRMNFGNISQDFIQSKLSFAKKMVNDKENNISKNKETLHQSYRQSISNVLDNNQQNKIKPKILSVQQLSTHRNNFIEIKQINLMGVSNKKKINLSLSKQDKFNSTIKNCSQHKSSNSSSLCKKSKLSLISNKSIRKISTLKLKDQGQIQNQEVAQRHQDKIQVVKQNIYRSQKPLVEVLNINVRKIEFKSQHRQLKTTRQIKQYKPTQQKIKIKLYKKKYQSLNDILKMNF